MTQWGPFLALAVVLTLLLLVFARLSQDAIAEYAPEHVAGPTLGDVDELASEETANHTVESDETDWKYELPLEDEQAELVETDTGTHRASAEEKRDAGEDIVLTPAMLMANVALTQGLVVLVLLAGVWYFEVPAAALGVTDAALSTGLPAVVVGTAFGVVLWIANDMSTTLADAVGASYDEQVRELLAPESAGGWVVLFVGVLPLIAFAEELLFRAALIGVPAAGFDINVWVLAALSSVAFAFGHGAQGRVGVVVTGALGFVLAAGYVVTGSLLVVVVAHYVVNALEFFVHEFLDVEAGTGDWLLKQLT